MYKVFQVFLSKFKNDLKSISEVDYLFSHGRSLKITNGNQYHSNVFFKKIYIP